MVEATNTKQTMPKTRYLVSELETSWQVAATTIPPSDMRLIVAAQNGMVWEGSYLKRIGFVHRDGHAPIIGATHWRLWPRNPNKDWLPDAKIELETY